MLAVSSIFFPWSGSSLEDVINSENHLRGLGGLDQDLSLDAEAFCDAKIRHAANLALILKTENI